MGCYVIKVFVISSYEIKPSNVFGAIGLFLPELSTVEPVRKLKLFVIAHSMSYWFIVEQIVLVFV